MNLKGTIRQYSDTLSLRYFQKFKLENLKPEENIIIAGTGRGGTTWFGEMFSKLDNSLLLWEPLHLEHVHRFNLDFNWRQYIPENENWPQAQIFFDKLFNGKILNTHLLQTVDWKSKKDTYFFIVKFCRANLMLPWLVRNYQFRKPILLVRHPLAVVSSQMRHKAYSFLKDDGNKYIISENRFTGMLHKKYEPILSKLSKREEILAADWCMDNIIPLNHPDNNKKWITVAYEQAVINPEEVFREIFDRWNINMPSNFLEQTTKPSKSTKKGSLILEGKNQIETWMMHLNKNQISNIMNVIDQFGFDQYSVELEPDYDKLYNR